MAHEHELSLPPIVVSPADVVRLRREIESLDEFLHQKTLRKEQAKDQTELPKLSRTLEACIGQNGLNMLKPADRALLNSFLESTLADSPVVHISFSSDPSSAFTAKIVTWFRENIHPAVLLQIGFQPTIAAGCMLRTPSHLYDFSVRRRFTDKKPLLVEKLQELSS